MHLGHPTDVCVGRNRNLQTAIVVPESSNASQVLTESEVNQYRVQGADYGGISGYDNARNKHMDVARQLTASCYFF